MSFNKIGENLSFLPEKNLLTPKQALCNEEIARRFVKMAKKLKQIAPKAKDFLYGHAIMMHAAEAALINQETGEPIKNTNGEAIKGYFEKIKVGGKDSVRWVSPDNIKPYRNANGDVFGEEELVKAYRKWIGKPLCKDHKSDSVDGIRGIIVDTHYDPKFKRVHALFALDRKNYADLARKVETGYATAVSMGTAVGRSVCTECANVATTEKEYCQCVRARKNYGEINLDLNPIELSLVVNGADQLAKIRNIVASLDSYVQTKQERIDQLVNDRCVNPTELQSLADTISDMQKKISGLMQLNKFAGDGKEYDIGELVAAIRDFTEAGDDEMAALIRKKLKDQFEAEGKTWPPKPEGMEQATLEDEPEFDSKMTGGGSEPSFSAEPHDTAQRIHPGEGQRLASENKGGGKKQGAFSKEIRLLRSKVESLNKSFKELKQIVSKEENNMNSARLRARAKTRRAYWLGGGGVNEPTPGKPKYEKEDAEKIRDKEDKQMTGEPLETGSEGMHPGDEEVKKKLLRAEDLEGRRLNRRAYWLGGGGINEPTPGKPKYEKEPMAEKVRDSEDKHLQGLYDMGGTDGMVPGDEKTKKLLLRARLRAKFTKVADETGSLVKEASRWDVFAGDKLILSATGEEIFGDELDENWNYLSSKEYGSDVIKHIRTAGFDRVSWLLKGAQPPADPMAGAMPPPPAGDMPPAPEAAPAPAMPEGEEKPKEDDDVKGKVEAALTKLEENIEDIRQAVTEGGKKLVDVEVKVDKGTKGEETGPMEQTLASNRKEALEVYALMDESADELALISESLDKLASLDETAKERVLVAAAQAVEDSEAILVEAAKIIDAKKKKEKKEKKEEKDEKKEEKDEKKEEKDEKKEEKDEEVKKEAAKKKEKKEKKEEKEEKDEKKEEKAEKKEEKDEEKEEKKEKKAQELLDRALRLRAQNRAMLLSQAEGMATQEAKQKAEELVGSEVKKMPAQAADGGCEGEDCLDLLDDMLDESEFVDEPQESVMAARKTAREELLKAAADKILGKYELDLGEAENATEKTYFEAHPGGKGTVTELTHTKTPEAKVETISEIHDIMRDVAESGPRNVREAAAMLQEEIVKGALKAEDIDKLVSEGKVDSAAASYWKKYFSQAPDAGSFGADLSKEFVSKKKEASDDTYKVKLRRAYDLGLQAQDKGFIEPTRASLDTYVDEVMKMDDGAFESTKRIIAKMSPAKKSGHLPRVGANAATEAMNVTASVEPVVAPNLVSQLNSLGWK